MFPFLSHFLSLSLKISKLKEKIKKRKQPMANIPAPLPRVPQD